MASHSPWRVSAIIPAFNRAGLLPETINSLLAQTTRPFEIIVVDDGSTDDTAATVAAFGGAVRYAHIDNSGAPVARNRGAALASGDWFWFCDSDDLWDPTYLEHCKLIAAASPHPRFIFGNFRLVRDGVWDAADKFASAPEGFWESLPRLPAEGGAILSEPIYASLLDFQPIFHSTIVMRRDVFEEVGGYDERFARTGSEDFEFALRCASGAPLGVVQAPLVGIRRHAGNFSADQLRCLLGELDILRHAKASHAAASALGPVFDAEIEHRTRQAIGLAFSAGAFDRVTALAATLPPASRMDLRARIKVALAALPSGARAPLVRLARLCRLGAAAP